MIDYSKLKKCLREIDADSKKQKPIDPVRGLSGELKRKMIAGLAGHRSGNFTDEEYNEIEKIQSEYDRSHS